MKKHRDYLRYVLLHKWYVALAGWRLGGIGLWRLLKHDWTKFSRAEWGPYVARFFGPEAEQTSPSTKEAFRVAWAHHYTHNDHHPEYWAGLPMPEVAVREMVADWHGAGRAKVTGSTVDWYVKHGHKLPLHPGSRRRAEELLGIGDPTDLIWSKG